MWDDAPSAAIVRRVHLASTFDAALMATTVAAVLARLAGVLTTGGAVAGAVVGWCVSLGFGLPGLAVLGTFFVVGSLATRVGWATKKARGTAEAGEGRRDWKRVMGKGGVAAVVALLVAFGFPRTFWWYADGAFAGAVAAALADTLGTEIGTLSHGTARRLPTFAIAPAGTPGAVSVAGTAAAYAGSCVVALVAVAVRIPPMPPGFVSETAFAACGISAAGIVASLLESTAVGVGLRAPGFVRNVFTTAAGAVLGGLLAWRVVT
jgi:uncharacterized protein (TIGR00297 family)